ncbi:MAG: hypothetical protein AAF937_08005 [Planctomycetota bacterium]
MDPWFSQQAAGVIGAVLGGGVGGVLCGIVGGGVCSVLAARGRARGFVLGYYTFLIVLGVALVAVSVAAMVMDQPFHVVYPFGLLAAILLIVVPSVRPAMKRQYQAFEQRRLDAEALRSA